MKVRIKSTKTLTRRWSSGIGNHLDSRSTIMARGFFAFGAVGFDASKFRAIDSSKAVGWLGPMVVAVVGPVTGMLAATADALATAADASVAACVVAADAATALEPAVLPRKGGAVDDWGEEGRY